MKLTLKRIGIDAYQKTLRFQTTMRIEEILRRITSDE